MIKKFIAAVAVGGLVVVGLPLQSQEAQDANPATAPAAPQAQETIVVKSSHVGSVLVLGGTVMPHKVVNLSAQMPGDVEMVAGSEGDAFKKGDKLVALDTKALLAKRGSALAQMDSAEAGYRNALVQYNREVLTPNSQSNSMLGGAPSMFSMFGDPMRSMMGQGSPGYERHSNLYGHGVKIETARNQIEQAKQGLRELDESLENAISYAPFDGIILKKMVEEGDIVQPGMPLVSFADTTWLQIRVEVPTRVLSSIEKGSLLQARLDTGDELVTVRVARIFPMADPGGHTTTVKFDLPKGTPAQSGMYAEVLVPDAGKPQADLPTVPQSAVVWRGSLPAVFKVQEDGSLKMKLIRIGETSPNGQISVISGINVGDKILKKPSANTRSSR